MTLQHRRQRSGQTGQATIVCLLRSLGFQCVEEVHTGMRMVGKINGKPRYVHSQKVSGDIRAVGPRGQSVLVEVKRRVKGNLTYSDLEPHQHRALNQHWDALGISLLAWVSDRGAILMFWNRVPLKKPRSSLTWDDAMAIRVGA